MRVKRTHAVHMQMQTPIYMLRAAYSRGMHVALPAALPHIRPRACMITMIPYYTKCLVELRNMRMLMDCQLPCELIKMIEDAPHLIVPAVHDFPEPRHRLAAACVAMLIHSSAL